jgi:hypothetical protein
MRVLVLNIDGLQPAYFGPYGCEWVPTLTLDRWAAAGIVYDQHFADCPDPAVRPGWRTGRHPLLPGGEPADLLTDLRAADVRTARVGPAVPTDGWDVNIDVKRDADPLVLKPTRRAVRQALEQLGDAADALLWVEIDALLPPWQPSAEAVAEMFEVFDDEEEAVDPWTDPLPERIAVDDDGTFDRLQRTFAAAVATLDASLDKLLIDCAKRGWGDDATWVLTAGRGFPLGEHGPVGFAAADLHEELVHLPLMVRRPNGEQAGMRVGSFTQPADLGALLRGSFGLPGGCSEPAARERAISGIRCGERTLWGVRSPGWYMMLADQSTSEPRLFVKPDDRWEVNDVRLRHQDLAEEMEREFRELIAAGGVYGSRPAAGHQT